MDNLSDRSNFVDILDNLSKKTRLSIAQQMQLAQLQIDTERLKIDEEKSRADLKFWNKNFVATIAAIISLAAVLISYSQVWSNNIQKEKELILKDKELEMIKSQKEAELSYTKYQEEIQRKIEIGKVILQYGDKLLSKDKTERGFAFKVLGSTLPKSELDQVLTYYEEKTDSPEIKKEIQTFRTEIRIPSVKTNGAGEILGDPKTRFLATLNSPLNVSDRNERVLNPAISPVPKISAEGHIQEKQPNSNQDAGVDEVNQLEFFTNCSLISPSVDLDVDRRFGLESWSVIVRNGMRYMCKNNRIKTSTE